MTARLALLVALSLLIVTPAHAKRLYHERHYQEFWCAAKGVTEFRLPDATRVDCLTPTHAIEFDFADKWAESIGQALHYARMTGKKAGIVLIIENPARDMKYVERVRNIITEYKLDIRLRIMSIKTHQLIVQGLSP